MTSWTLRRTVGTSAALLAAAVGGLTAVGTPAHAGTAHHITRATAAVHAPRATSKKFTFVTGGTALNGKASKQVGLFHGAISAGGTDQPHGQSDVAHLPGGTITVKHPDKTTKFVPTLDKSTCYLTFTLTGKFTLANGTGKYRGVAGSGTFTGHGYGYLPRTKSGSCSMTAAPKTEVFSVLGKGTLS